MEIDPSIASTSSAALTNPILTSEKTSSTGSGPIYHSCKSPNFNYLAVGNEADKLKWLVLQHVKPTAFKKIFAPLMSPNKKDRMKRTDELTCVEACMLLRVLEPLDKTKPPIELEQACHGLIDLLNTEKIFLNALDRIITKIIITAANEKIISLLFACQLLVTSIDFRMLKPPNPEKIQFVRKSMDEMDYKNMRDLLKLLLVEKLDKMHCNLTEYQHRELAPIEELVIDLIDRGKNYCPALFFITEISRIDTDHSSIHFLPRVSLKIREMVASFRPLAEIGSMLGRSWMWPVPASPIFSWSSQTWSAWKLDEKHCKLYFKTHLPYSSENSSPQTYLQYILFKQPHGQDNLNHLLRPSNTQNPTPRLPCDEVIQLLILEAMCAMEDSEQPVLAPINQYNWLHLSHLVTYALSMGNCILSQLLMMLLPQLKSCQYLRAKEELMWILLQYIAHAKSKEKKYFHQQAQQNATGGHVSAMIALPTSGGLGAQNRELVLEIFNVLYGPDKSMNWGDSCSTEQPLNMVRFFAPAAIWINLVSSHFFPPGSEHQLPQPQPPEKLQTLIDFIEKQLRDNKEQKQLEKNPALLAVVANAYSNISEIFEEHVNTTIFRMLGQHSHPQQPPQIQPEKWALLGGRKTEPFLRALELSFLDSLTFHAKRQLYNSSFIKICNPVVAYLNNIQQQPPQQPLQSFVWRLPSPALVESTARLLLSTELCDQNGQCFYQYAAYFLKAQNPIQSDTKELFFARNDLLAMFLELLNFRLQNIGFGWKWEINIRLTFFINVFEQLISNQLLNQSPVPYNIQLCQLLEQTILRFAQCTWSQDMLSTLQRVQIFKWIKIIPELCRAFLLSALRAAKLLGDGQLQMAHEIGWQWPQADIQWFPVGVQQILNEQTAQYEQEWMAKHAQRMMELEQASAQEMQQLFNLDADYFGLSQPTQTVYNNQTLLISIFRCLYQFQIPGFQVPQPMKNPHPGAPNFAAFCYKLLGSLGNRSLHILTNALVDWLAWKFAWLGQQQTIMQPQTQEEYDLPHMLKVLNDMLFLHQFISIERLLFSMTLHPTDDQSIRTLLCLLAALLDSKYSQLSERLHACYAFAPRHSQTTSSNSEDFFMQMSEYYKKYQEVSFAELYRRAMSQTPPNDPNNEHLNLPIYYGHLAERICPNVDVLLQRAIQIDMKPAVLDTLLRHFSPIYRIHPQPMTFIYTTLYSLDGILLQQNENSGRNVRKFVLEIVMKLEQEEVQQSQVGRPSSVSHAGKLLTTEFIQHDHQMPPIKFCRILVERIVQASTYTHQPPPFVHHDWRFAEFSPAAQALTSAWIELMASRYSPAEIVDALVQLAIQRPISRPLDTLNALGLLLTGLPASFQYAFLNKIEQSFDWEQIADPEADPAQLFESLSYEVYLHSESRILSMLALIHSFCQHGGNNSLCIIPDLIINRLAKKVQNEAQLLYFLRIVVPYLQRIHEKERSRHMPEIVAIYEVLGTLTQKIGQLRYEDTICDLLYQFKYMFVGYSLKDQTELAIRTFPDSMREKLKFLLTHSSSVATETQQQQMQQILQQQQQILRHQSSQGSLLSGSAPMSTAAMLAAAQQQQATQFGHGGHQQQHVAGSQPHPSQFPSQIPPPHLQQPPLFGPQPMHGPSFDPAMAAAHQPALIEMLRRQSRESGGDGGPIPPPAAGTAGMSTTMGMGQQPPPATTNPLSLASLSTGGGHSANASPNSQSQPPQFPTTSAQTVSQPQQLAPPPPYSQMHHPSGPAGMHPMMGPIGQMPSFPPGQMPITTSGGQFLPANFQQMMNAQQQMAAAQGQFLPGPPGQQPFIPHQLPPQQMGFASAAQQAQMVQMGGANRRPNSDDGQFPPQFQ